MNNKDRLSEPDVIRAVTAVIVVLFHAYGMMYTPAHFPDTVEIYREKYYWFNSICLWFHMPLFIFISGGVYGYLYHVKGKYRDTLPFIWNKMKRLLIPYVIFSVIFMVTTNGWSWSGLFSGTYSHLWFLTMLFWCFVGIAVIDMLRPCMLRFFPTPIVHVLILIISFIGLLLPKLDYNLLGIAYFYKWFFWFYLGYSIYMNRNKVYICIKKTLILPFVLPFLYGCCMWYMVTCVGTYGGNSKCFISEIGFACIVLWIWYVLCWLIEKFGTSWTQCWLIKELSLCSFGIYIFHNWIEPFMISRTAQKLLPLADWSANHTVLFPLVFSLLALLISYILTKIVLRTKIGRSLLG